ATVGVLLTRSGVLDAAGAGAGQRDAEARTATIRTLRARASERAAIGTLSRCTSARAAGARERAIAGGIRERGTAMTEARQSRAAVARSVNDPEAHIADRKEPACKELPNKLYARDLRRRRIAARSRWKTW